VASSESKREKAKKIAALIPKFRELKVNYFSPTIYIKMDEPFIELLASIDVPVDD
jgi:hypothetical protein